MNEKSRILKSFIREVVLLSEDGTTPAPAPTSGSSSGKKPKPAPDPTKEKINALKRQLAKELKVSLRKSDMGKMLSKVLNNLIKNDKLKIEIDPGSSTTAGTKTPPAVPTAPATPKTPGKKGSSTKNPTAPAPASADPSAAPSTPTNPGAPTAPTPTGVDPFATPSTPVPQEKVDSLVSLINGEAKRLFEEFGHSEDWSGTVQKFLREVDGLKGLNEKEFIERFKNLPNFKESLKLFATARQDDGSLFFAERGYDEILNVFDGISSIKSVENLYVAAADAMINDLSAPKKPAGDAGTSGSGSSSDKGGNDNEGSSGDISEQIIQKWNEIHKEAPSGKRPDFGPLKQLVNGLGELKIEPSWFILEKDGFTYPIPTHPRVNDNTDRTYGHYDIVQTAKGRPVMKKLARVGTSEFNLARPVSGTVDKGQIEIPEEFS